MGLVGPVLGCKGIMGRMAGTNQNAKRFCFTRSFADSLWHNRKTIEREP